MAEMKKMEKVRGSASEERCTCSLWSADETVNGQFRGVPDQGVAQQGALQLPRNQHAFRSVSAFVLPAVDLVLFGVGEAAEIPGKVEGDRGGVGAG